MSARLSNIGSPSLAELFAAGLTRRQVEHWTAKGYLRPHNSSPGSGYQRVYPPEELAVARVMARLVHAGLTLEGAHRAARQDGELAAGVQVVVDGLVP